MLTLHVHNLTVMSGGGGHGGAVTGEKAAKPMATVQYWFLTLSLNILKETLAQFPSMFVVTKKIHFWHKVRTLGQMCQWRQKQVFWNSEHWVFLSLTKWFLCEPRISINTPWYWIMNLWNVKLQHKQIQPIDSVQKCMLLPLFWWLGWNLLVTLDTFV